MWKMEEIVIDMRTPAMLETLSEMQRSAKLCYQINHTEPYTEEMQRLVDELFEGRLDKSSRIVAPIQIDIAKNITIGKNVFINHNFNTMARGGIIIEDNVMIALGVTLLTANHDLYDHQILRCKPIHIKRNAWIGANVNIMPGVTIGENAVVAAGAIVTKDVEPNTVVGGNPAKFIKDV